MVAPLYTTDSGLLFHAGKILIVTVGLPARGKTHMSRALERYLRWMGVKTLVVSLGDYRRKMLGGTQKLPADYFSLGEKSEETIKLRTQIQTGCESRIDEYFKGGGQVVIYDANNGTRAARNRLAEKFDKEGIHVIFMESLCDNKEIIERNIRSVKVSSPDYKGWDQNKAVEDYYSRIQDREKTYESLEETTWPYIRIWNVGEKIMVNDIQGYLQSRIVFFLMNIHNRQRTIYFARSGQSLIEHSFRADSDLSPAGWDYAETLKEFLLERRSRSLEARGLDPKTRKLVIWTSARRRSHHTAWPFLAAASTSSHEARVAEAALLQSHINLSALTHSSSVPAEILSYSPTSPTSVAPAPTAAVAPLPPSLTHSHSQSTSQTSQSHTPKSRADTPSSNAVSRVDSPLVNVRVVQKAQMGEINPGVWDGLNLSQTRKFYPEDWERFSRDPYSYRAPRAESYHDLSVRLEPTLIELEREQEDLLIIGHASVIRCMLAYLIGLPPSEIPAIEVARGDLIEVVPASYGVHSQAFHFWDGPGRRDESGAGGEGGDKENFYENIYEDTKGKRIVVGDGVGFGGVEVVRNEVGG